MILDIENFKSGSLQKTCNKGLPSFFPDFQNTLEKSLKFNLGPIISPIISWPLTFPHLNFL